MSDAIRLTARALLEAVEVWSREPHTGNDEDYWGRISAREDTIIDKADALRAAFAAEEEDEKNTKIAEPTETCEWCGRDCPRSKMNTVPWPDNEHTRRICDRCCDEGN